MASRRYLGDAYQRGGWHVSYNVLFPLTMRLRKYTSESRFEPDKQRWRGKGSSRSRVTFPSKMDQNEARRKIGIPFARQVNASPERAVNRVVDQPGSTTGDCTKSRSQLDLCGLEEILMPPTKAQDAERINALAERAFGLLSQLGSPVHCGHAFAIAQAKLMIESGLETDKQVRTAMATMTREVLKHFKRMRSEENLLVCERTAPGRKRKSD